MSGSVTKLTMKFLDDIKNDSMDSYRFFEDYISRGFRYLAMDEDGRWFIYKKEPEINSSGYYGNDIEGSTTFKSIPGHIARSIKMNVPMGCLDWETSLMELPEITSDKRNSDFTNLEDLYL